MPLPAHVQVVRGTVGPPTRGRPAVGEPPDDGVGDHRDTPSIPGGRASAAWGARTVLRPRTPDQRGAA